MMPPSEEPVALVSAGLSIHHKAHKAGAAAMGLWVMAMAWSKRRETDGFIPHCTPATLVEPELADAAAATLVRVGLWEVADGPGWRFHDWEEHQAWPEEDAEEMARQAAISSARSEAGRKGGVSSGRARRAAASSRPGAEAKRSNREATAKQNGGADDTLTRARASDPDPDLSGKKSLHYPPESTSPRTHACVESRRIPEPPPTSPSAVTVPAPQVLAEVSARGVMPTPPVPPTLPPPSPHPAPGDNWHDLCRRLAPHNKYAADLLVELDTFQRQILTKGQRETLLKIDARMRGGDAAAPVPPPGPLPEHLQWLADRWLKARAKAQRPGTLAPPAADLAAVWAKCVAASAAARPAKNGWTPTPQHVAAWSIRQYLAERQVRAGGVDDAGWPFAWLAKTSRIGETYSLPTERDVTRPEAPRSSGVVARTPGAPPPPAVVAIAGGTFGAIPRRPT